jgi:hypothetical protein
MSLLTQTQGGAALALGYHGAASQAHSHDSRSRFFMLYRVTLSLCGLIVASAGVYVGVRMSVAIGLSIAVTQTVVFGVLAAYAYACRRSRVATYVVLGMVGLTGVLACVLVAPLAREMHPMGMMVWSALALGVQGIVAIFGGYLGYACMEAERLRPSSPNHVRGKLVVVGILALALVAAGVIWAGGAALKS